MRIRMIRRVMLRNYTRANVLAMLDFAVSFASMNLKRFTPVEWDSLRNKFRYLLFESGAGSAWPMDRPGEREFQRLQAETEKLLNEVTKERDWQGGYPGPPLSGISLPTISLRSLRYSPMVYRDGGMSTGACASTRHAFIKTICDVLVGFPGIATVARCPECDSLFVRSGKKQYCSRACVNRVTVRLWRKKQKREQPKKHK